MRPASLQRGFTYLLLLFFVAITGASLAVLGDIWETYAQREREAQLLFAGSAIRQAIGSYYDSTPGPVKQYPAELEQLLKDPRFPDTRRHLRQIYLDPMTGTAKWVTIKAPQGGIMGVASSSERTPLKRRGFLGGNQLFEDQANRLKEKLRYRDWEFVYDPLLKRITG